MARELLLLIINRDGFSGYSIRFPRSKKTVLTDAGPSQRRTARRGRNQMHQLRRSRMFIATATKASDLAPAELNASGPREIMSLLRSLGVFFVTGFYRHFVPLGLWRKTLTVLITMGSLTAASAAFAQKSDDRMTVRVKDVAEIEGVRGNQLIGYGLVIGLNRTGDR